jgi:TROVE domain-containing protein
VDEKLAGGKVSVQRPEGLIAESGRKGDAKKLPASPRRLTASEQWELAIPNMGYMALLRNLRNFDQAGVSDVACGDVAARLADPGQVARSHQFPFRFYTAYINAPSLRWGAALESALQASLANVPELPGSSLVLIDASNSMTDVLSKPPEKPGRKRPKYGQEPVRPSRMSCAALFGLATALANTASAVDVWGFADGQFQVTGIGRGHSLLRGIETFCRQHGRVGTGTRIELAVRSTYRQHDRVFIFTDEQTELDRTSPAGYYLGDWKEYRRVYHGDFSSAVPPSVPVYVWNLAGYTHGGTPVDASTNRHAFAGFGDHCFRMIQMIEAGRSATWPWENAA